MAILVTGCAGFIGSAVTGRLLAQGQDVIGIDNLDSVNPRRLLAERLNPLRRHKRFQFHRVDLQDQARVNQILKKTDVESILHLGAKAGVRPSLEKPLDYFETNTLGTLKLLEICRALDVPRFLLASTSSVYGASATPPFVETSDTGSPMSPYAASKRAAEIAVATYHNLYGFRCAVPRFFTVYGPAGRPDMSVFRFIQAIAEGRPITIFGDGRQRRDFTFIDDIARGTILALRKTRDFQIFNLGSNRPVSILQLIARIEAKLGRTTRIVFQKAHPTDMSITWANLKKTRRDLGWKPEVPIGEGIGRTIDWYSANRKWARRLQRAA